MKMKNKKIFVLIITIKNTMHAKKIIKKYLKRYYSSSSAIVKISYEDVMNPNTDLSAKIDEAYNYNGYGILAVSDIPNLVEKRLRLLKIGNKFANLSSDITNKYEHEKSFFSVGWSHGKELFQGIPDYSKGSWYANPKIDEPTTDKELIDKYPSYFTPNIWPEEAEDMQNAFKELGNLMMNTGINIARHCDNFVSNICDGYKNNTLEQILLESMVPKGRLLHYFSQDINENADPLNQENIDQKLASWCGWHNDHGALTALTSAMFTDKDGNDIKNPDPQAGLYVKTRNGESKRITFPVDCLGFQIGEASQILSGGILQATPHAVMGPTIKEASGVSRDTLAIFMQPMPQTILELPAGRSRQDVEKGSTAEFMPPGTPELSIRYDPGIDFGTFTNRTLENYH